MSPGRVVVTGVGVVSPLGIGREAFWKRVLEGGSPFAGARRRGVVHDFDAARILRAKGLRYLGPGTRFLAGAARLALDDAGLDAPDELGFVVGTGFGNVAETFHFTHKALTKGVDQTLPMDSFDAALNSQTNFTAVYLGAQRFTKTICGMTASLEAVIDAADMIRAGRARAAIASGMDYWTADLERWVEWQRYGGDGVAEGAYALVLEDAGHAAARSAAALVEVGSGATAFATVGSGREQARRLTREVLGDAAADLWISCGPSWPDRGPCGRAARRVRLREVAGDCLGARGALGVVLAALASATRALPRGDELPPAARRILVADAEPGGSLACLALRPFEDPA